MASAVWRCMWHQCISFSLKTEQSVFMSCDKPITDEQRRCSFQGVKIISTDENAADMKLGRRVLCVNVVKRRKEIWERKCLSVTCRLYESMLGQFGQQSHTLTTVQLLILSVFMYLWARERMTDVTYFAWFFLWNSFCSAWYLIWWLVIVSWVHLDPSQHVICMICLNQMCSRLMLNLTNSDL